MKLLELKKLGELTIFERLDLRPDSLTFPYAVYSQDGRLVAESKYLFQAVAFCARKEPNENSKTCRPLEGR